MKKKEKNQTERERKRKKEEKKTTIKRRRRRRRRGAGDVKSASITGRKTITAPLIRAGVVPDLLKPHFT